MTDHSGRTSRLLVTGAVAIAVVSVAAGILVPGGGSWALGVVLAGYVVLAFAALVCFLVSMLGLVRYGPPRFVVRNGTFQIPTSRSFALLVTGQLLMFAVLGGGAAERLAHLPAEHGAELAVDVALPAITAVLAGLTGLTLIGVVAAVLLRRPVIVLTPDALVARDPLGTRIFPWDALLPWPVVRGPLSRQITLLVGRPELVRRTGLVFPSRRLVLAYAEVHPQFLIDVIQGYLLRPDERAAIGTAAGHDRLLVGLGVRAAA